MQAVFSTGRIFHCKAGDIYAPQSDSRRPIEKFTLLDHYFFICLTEYLGRNSGPLDITYGFYTVALLLAAGVFAFISSDKLKLLEKNITGLSVGAL